METQKLNVDADAWSAEGLKCCFFAYPWESGDKIRCDSGIFSWFYSFPSSTTFLRNGRCLISTVTRRTDRERIRNEKSTWQTNPCLVTGNGEERRGQVRLHCFSPFSLLPSPCYWRGIKGSSLDTPCGECYKFNYAPPEIRGDKGSSICHYLSCHHQKICSIDQESKLNYVSGRCRLVNTYFPLAIVLFGYSLWIGNSCKFSESEREGAN